MQTVQKQYAEKLSTVPDVLAKIRSGDKIVTGFSAGEPQALLSQMHTIAPQVENVELWTAMSFPKYEVLMNPDMKGHFEANTWFHGPGSRAAFDAGIISTVPAHLHNGIWRSIEVEKPNIFFGTCTPPDQHGYVYMAMGLVYERIMLERETTMVVLEVNPNMPRVYGETEIPISRVDHFIEVDYPVPALPPAQPSERDLVIGQNAASLVHDGDTFQLGIGAIPNAVALAFMDKKNLGVHTEMLSSSVADLVEAGVVNGSRKTLHKGKIIATFMLGDQKLYDFADCNPSVQLLDGRYVNDPRVIAQNDNMVSINTTIQVDLSGQACSEGIGHRMYSGSGGQNDTAEGAIHAKNGRSILCLYSTAKNDTISTIVPTFYPGAVVTLSRNNIDYIVTEYGIALMKGQSIRQRAKNLIAIAHPKFREELAYAVKEQGII